MMGKLAQLAHRAAEAEHEATNAAALHLKELHQLQLWQLVLC